MKKRKIKLNWFNAILLTCGGISLVLLIHDILFWAVIPFFTGEFYQLTYLGMFIDLGAAYCVEMSIRLLEEK